MTANEFFTGVANVSKEFVESHGRRPSFVVVNPYDLMAVELELGFDSYRPQFGEHPDNRSIAGCVELRIDTDIKSGEFVAVEEE